MDKIVQYKGIDELGNVFVTPVKSNMVGIEKLAKFVHPEVTAFMSSIKEGDDFLYVLLNAMGASEWWGQNINGDIFPEKSLIGGNHPQHGLYGYKSFVNAGTYRHHRNKNPEISFGDFPVCVYNPVMHRVELINRIDRNRAENLGAGHICSQIDSGMFPDVSMGTKVPYDVCSLCGNHSKTRNDYCEHLQTMMGKILPDGLKVGAINDYPRFFDLSYVTFGADRTAKAMAKLAAVNGQLVQHKQSFLIVPDLDTYPGFSKTASHIACPKVEAGGNCTNCTGKCVLPSAELSEEVEKLAAKEKKAVQTKGAVINKNVTPQFHAIVRALSSREPLVPPSLLDEVSTSRPLSSVLGTTASMGIVLRPEEFQRTVLRIVDPSRARFMERGRLVFAPSDQFDGPPDMDFDESLVDKLLPLIKERSWLGPPVRRRITILVIRGRLPDAVEPYREVGQNDELLGAISRGYNSYRRRLVEDMPRLAQAHTSMCPRLRHAIMDRDIEDAFIPKTAEALDTTLTDGITLAYLGSWFEGMDKEAVVMRPRRFTDRVHIGGN